MAEKWFIKMAEKWFIKMAEKWFIKMAEKWFIKMAEKWFIKKHYIVCEEENRIERNKKITSWLYIIL